MKLVETLYRSDTIFKKLKHLILENNLDYKFNEIVSVVNVFSNELTLYYIHPYIQNSRVNRCANILKFIFKSILKRTLNNIKFSNNKEKLEFNSRKYNLFLCFSIYISKDSLFDLIEPILENKENHILILYDEIEIKKDKIFKLINNSSKRIKIIPIQSFYNDVSKNEYQEQKNIIKKLNWYRSQSFNIFFNIYLRTLYLNNIRYFFSSFELFKKVNITNIISSDTNDFRCRLIIEIAKTYKINTAEIQYGMYGKEAIEFRNFNSDKIFVWGDMYKKIMINHGISSEKIIISGPIRLEKYKNISFNKKNNNIVLYAPTHKKHPSIPIIVKKMNNMLINLSIDFPNFSFLIKPHPLDDSSDFKKIPQNVTLIPNSDDIRDYINECDIFISSGSTTTIDALFLNKRVLVFNLPGWENFVEPFENFIDCKFINNYNDLFNTMLSYTPQLNNNFNKLIHFDTQFSSSKIIINSLVN